MSSPDRLIPTADERLAALRAEAEQVAAAARRAAIQIDAIRRDRATLTARHRQLERKIAALCPPDESTKAAEGSP